MSLMNYTISIILKAHFILEIKLAFLVLCLFLVQSAITFQNPILNIIMEDMKVDVKLDYFMKQRTSDPVLLKLNHLTMLG